MKQQAECDSVHWPKASSSSFACDEIFSMSSSGYSANAAADVDDAADALAIT